MSDFLKIIYAFIVISLILIGGVFYLSGNSFSILPSLEDGLMRALPPSVGDIAEDLREISAPEPLRRNEGAPASAKSLLTSNGIIKLTNAERTKLGLNALTPNDKLTASALVKAKDIIDRQYFAHAAPTGEGAGDLADTQGYDYVLIGENLALGDFADDADVILGWMNSPGHRANILNSRYWEIGVAAVKGVYEGRMAWVAVQEFGLPSSACPKPNLTIKENISDAEDSLVSMAGILDEKKSELENMRPKRGEEYNARIDEYNALVADYNKLVQTVKELVTTYNFQVKAFNDCAR